MWLGYFEEFPDYLTQGEALEELQVNLAPIIRSIWRSSALGPGKLKHAPLELQAIEPMWDMLWLVSLAAAEALGTDTVYSEDLSHRQRYGRVRVLNPFARQAPAASNSTWGYFFRLRT